MSKHNTSSISGFVLTVVLFLLSSGVSVADAETPDESRLRQLAGQAASYAGEVRALLTKGASPNVPGQGGRTAVHGAARIGAAETMRALLEADGNPKLQDEDGNTPLHFAADRSAAQMPSSNAVATIRLLLQAGADANRANARGRTPLHVAARSHNRPEAVLVLLGGGADPNRKDRQGDTPLHAALDPNGWPGVVQALLSGGANPRTNNRGGLNALQLFVREGPDHGDTAAMLIDAGADPSRKYPDGDAPLHAAIRTGGSRGKVRVAEALLAGGADPCARDARGYIPYNIAKEKGAIHQALARAGGYERACDKKGERVSAETGRLMQARSRANLRSGPSAQHEKVGLIEAGQEVRVTGEVGDWLQIETTGGGEAFVHASLLIEVGSQADLEPRCAGLKKGAECWKEVANQRGCHVWNSYLQPAQTVTWSGACPGTAAGGQGELIWTMDGKSTQETGTLDRGKKRGKWTIRYASGTVAEGPFVNGKYHGRWVIRYANGAVHEGEAVDGKKHGRWVERSKYVVKEGPYVKGKRQGRWVIRWENDKSTSEGPYVNGKRQGHWVVRWDNGNVQEGPYVNDKRHGHWVKRWGTGAREGPYVNGEMHGHWVWRWNNGSVEEGPYVNGKKHGRWVERMRDGRIFESRYVEDRMQGGQWVKR